MIIIKKYPNRRLYDTDQSKYINLDDIKQLINNHQEFQVLDSKTDDDLTKSILLQIISEQETSDQQSLLTNTLLKQLIRFYDSDMQVFVRQYLEQSLTHFLDQQDTVQTVMQQMVQTSPMGMFGKLMEQNLELWQQMQKGGKKKE